jgi:hypothetical protein
VRFARLVTAGLLDLAATRVAPGVKLLLRHHFRTCTEARPAGRDRCAGWQLTCTTGQPRGGRLQDLVTVAYASVPTGPVVLLQASCSHQPTVSTDGCHESGALPRSQFQLSSGPPFPARGR